MGDDHTLARPIDFDDLHLQRPPHEAVERMHVSGLHVRGGQEPAHSKVDHQAALDAIGHHRAERLAVLVGLGDAPPHTLVVGPLLGQHRVALFALGPHDIDREAVSHRQRLPLLGLRPHELCWRKVALRFRTHIDERPVFVDVHD